jgi:cytochrome d ubiquinol oxidase subunit II
MNVAAFWLLAFMLTVYVLLDGYDFGVAMITPFVARSDEERLASMRSVGPFWNGNEVWLIATGAVLFAMFPQAYASAFSGFYLPFMVALWLLMFRGISLELRGHFLSRIWHDFWDACFFLSSALLVLTFGVAFGNLLHGLPLGDGGSFRGTFALLLNPYALLVGAFAVAALAMHGAAFLRLRLDGAPSDRAAAAFVPIWSAVVVLYVVVTVWTLLLRSGFGNVHLFVVAMIVLSLAALAAIQRGRARNHAVTTFLASSAFLATLLVAAAGTLFPYLLPAYRGGPNGISIYSGAPSLTGITTAFAFTVAGLIGVIIFSTIAWRRVSGKIRV